MQGRALDLRGAMIADSGHFVMEENPQDFLAHLLPFLDGHPAVLSAPQTMERRA
jgi:hypothetical protein